MSNSVENHVRTVIARALELTPLETQPDAPIAGVASKRALREISHALGLHYDVAFPAGAYKAWSTVADVVIATEAAIAAGVQRSAA